ncbi:MFS transporter [Fluviispira multicolorata]|nr:MFS transporter [Fluviispira multicolorata]
MYYRLIFLDFFLTSSAFLYYIAIIGGVYKANQSASQIGFIALAITLPSFLISFFSGRFFKSHLLIKNIHFCSIIKFFALIVLYFYNYNTSILMILIILNGILDQIIRVSKQSFDAIQIEPELRAKFNSKKTFLSEIAIIVGPALGGIVAAFYSLSQICLSLSFLCLIPIFFLINLKNVKINFQAARQEKTLSFKENILYLFSKRIILFLIISYCLVVIVLEMQTPLIFPFVKEKFNADNSITGILFSMAGIGGITGALIPMFLKFKNEALSIILLVIFDGLLVFLFTISGNFYISCTIFTLLGLMGAVTIVLVETKVQNDLEEKYRPFAFSIIQLAKSTLGASLAAASGVFADIIGAVKVLRYAAYIEIFAGILLLTLIFKYLKIDEELNNRQLPEK